ncbi:hypothetical protein GCM10011428_49610 [Streptomyces violaceus]|nr:hypothetical protein GCM10010270_18050 [Streptomyces janthinus]
MIDRQSEVAEAFGERLGDRLVVLDEQHSYAHTSCLSVSRHESGQREFPFSALEFTRYKMTVGKGIPTKNVQFLAGLWSSLNLPL